MIAYDPEGLDLARIGCFSAVLRGSDPMEHVLLSDGFHRVRLDVRGGSVTTAPVRLRFAFDGLDAIEAPLLTLRRLIAFGRRGVMPRALFGAERRAGRWIAALRASDARRAGASQREIAALLVGSGRVLEDWAESSDYLRSRVRRLLEFGERMRAGGWRGLLDAGPHR